jgi:hypothetical protein
MLCVTTWASPHPTSAATRAPRRPCRAGARQDLLDVVERVAHDSRIVRRMPPSPSRASRGGGPSGSTARRATGEPPRRRAAPERSRELAIASPVSSASGRSAPACVLHALDQSPPASFAPRRVCCVRFSMSACGAVCPRAPAHTTDAVSPARLGSALLGASRTGSTASIALRVGRRPRRRTTGRRAAGDRRRSRRLHGDRRAFAPGSRVPPWSSGRHPRIGRDHLARVRARAPVQYPLPASVDARRRVRLVPLAPAQPCAACRR